MPKMLREAGINNLIFSRGPGDEARELGAVFNWVADDETPLDDNDAKYLRLRGGEIVTLKLT